MKEKTTARREIYSGRVLSLERLEVELESGVRSFREVVRHRGAVAVLARRPDGRFVLVKQFRKPLERHFVEVVAGLKEEGEPPEACARREVEEETGYTVRSLVRAGAVCPSPGYTDEVIDIFFAELNASPRPQSWDEDEHIEVMGLAREEIERMISAGEIQDGKTLAAWLLCETLATAPQGKGEA